MPLGDSSYSHLDTAMHVLKKLDTYALLILLIETINVRKLKAIVCDGGFLKHQKQNPRGLKVEETRAGGEIWSVAQL